MIIKSYKDLEVWNKAMDLAKKVYTATQTYPKNELYGLINQMRRSAISIPSNIAEGKTRQTKKEYIRFLYVTLGSIAELETQVILSKELGYIDNSTNDKLLKDTDCISRMTRGLVKSLLSTQYHEPQTTNLKPNKA